MATKTQSDSHNTQRPHTEFCARHCMLLSTNLRLNTRFIRPYAGIFPEGGKPRAPTKMAYFRRADGGNETFRNVFGVLD